jgi:hypothetical protein
MMQSYRVAPQASDLYKRDACQKQNLDTDPLARTGIRLTLKIEQEGLARGKAMETRAVCGKKW